MIFQRVKGNTQGSTEQRIGLRGKTNWRNRVHTGIRLPNILRPVKRKPPSLSHAFRWQPSGEGGDRLVHDEVPGCSQVEASNRFPDAHAPDRIEFNPTARSGRQHRKQARTVHRVIDRTRQLAVRLRLSVP